MTLEEIRSRLEAFVPGCSAEIVVNGSPSAQNSLLIDRQHGLHAAMYLRDHPELSGAGAADGPVLERKPRLE